MQLWSRRSVRAGIGRVAICLILAGSAMAQSAAQFSVVYTFPTPTPGGVGSRPGTPLTLGPDGNLYGTTPQTSLSTGTIFRVTPQGSLTTLYTYPQIAFAAQAPGPLTLGADGALYGIDINATRSVFRMTTDGGFSILATSPNNFYSSAYFGLLAGADGNLYGVAYDSNVNPTLIYQITLAGDMNLIHTLDPTTEGAGVLNMIQGSDGAIYGMAGNAVGSRGHTFFTILPDGTFMVLATFPINTYAFNPATSTYDGAQCLSGITEGVDGNFYCISGEAQNLGVVGLSPAGVMIHYQNVNEPGSTPAKQLSPVLDVFAPMVLGLDGNLYGTAETSEVTSTIFQLSVQGVKPLYTTPSGGGNIVSSCFFGLTLAPDGTFYGTCATSENYVNGYIFALGPRTGGGNSPVQISKLAAFDAQPSFVDADSVNDTPSGLVSDPTVLAGPGRLVVGAAADGVSRVLLRGSTIAPLTYTLADENMNPVGNSTEYGGLAQVTDPGTPFSNSILIEPVNVNGNSLSLVAYLAPMDFVRSDPTFNSSDQEANSRKVNIVITAGDGTVVATYPMTLVRPPVVMIHGITSEPRFWKTFQPLVNNCAAPTVSGDPRFYVLCADWSKIVPGVVSIDPNYLGVGSIISAFVPIRQNELGYSYNAPVVFSQMQNAAANYSQAAPPAGNLPIASVQVDAVGHSMGNLIARTMPYTLLPPNAYLQTSNYGQGIMHKLISVAGPHMGAPMAGVTLDPKNACTWIALAVSGNYPLNAANFGLSVTSGGALDLTGDGQGQCASTAINTLQGTADKQIPVALIGGEMSTSQLNGFGGSLQVLAVKLVSSVKAVQLACSTDYFMPNFNSAGWLTLMGLTSANQSDAFVPVPSALDGLSASGACTVPTGQTPPAPCSLSLVQYAVHGPGTTEQLGFPEPEMLDNSSVPMMTINLLNAQVGSPAFLTLPSVGFPQVGGCK